MVDHISVTRTDILAETKKYVEKRINFFFVNKKKKEKKLDDGEVWRNKSHFACDAEKVKINGIVPF